MEDKVYKIVTTIGIELYCTWEAIWTWIPGRIGRLIRKFVIAPFLSYDIPKYRAIWKIEIPEYVHFWEPWKICCKGYVRFGKYSQINGAGRINIGSDVMMGPYTMITTVNHNFTDKNTIIRKMPSHLQEVNIGDDVWIGGHCSILSGAAVPNGCVLAAGAIYTANSKKSEYAVYAGIPAKQIKVRSM